MVFDVDDTDVADRYKKNGSVFTSFLQTN